MLPANLVQLHGVEVVQDAPSEVASPSFHTRASLTDRQGQVLAFIKQTIASRGFPPTVREIGDHLGIRSTNGAFDHLLALERKGYLSRENTRSRSIRLTTPTPIRRPDPSPDALFLEEALRAENRALRELLRRVAEASTRLPSRSVELIVLLGDVREVLATKEPG